MNINCKTHTEVLTILFKNIIKNNLHKQINNVLIIIQFMKYRIIFQMFFLITNTT